VTPPDEGFRLNLHVGYGSQAGWGGDPAKGYSVKATNSRFARGEVTPDVLVNNVGSLYTFCPLTLRAKEWIDEHVQDDAQWFGYVLVVEHRFAWGLAEGMKDAGLVLQ
jgi:hypothetical protein